MDGQKVHQQVSSLATVCMCVSFTSAESCAKLQYAMLSLRSHTSHDVLDQLPLALTTSVRVSGSVRQRM